MDNYCILCGEVLDDGILTFQHHQFKKMCLNCAYAEHTVPGDTASDLICKNEDNKKLFIEKMKEAANAITESYSVDNIEISPLPIKKPTRKCKQWVLNENVKNSLVDLFV